MIKIINKNDEDLDKILRIYIHSFPAQERLDIGTYVKRIEKNEEILLGYYNNFNVNNEHKSELVGFASIFPLGKLIKNENLYYNVLNYFAIDVKYRKMNYGFLFLKYIIHSFIQENNFLIVEVENPYIKDVHSIEYKRLKFYRKFKIEEYPDFTYNMPSLSYLLQNNDKNYFSNDNKISMKLLSIASKEKKIFRLNNIQLFAIREAILKQMYYLDEFKINSLNLYDN